MSDDVTRGAPTLGADAAHHAPECDCLLCEGDDEETDVTPTYGVLGGLR